MKQQLAKVTFKLLCGAKYCLDWSRYNFQRGKIHYGLIPANMEFAKFVIVSGPRCGSTMLARGLMQHTNVVCLGEVFRKNELTWDSYDTPGYFMPMRARRLYEKSLEEFAEQYVYCWQPAFIKAVGCKLHYGQGKPELNEYLKNHQEIKIIHQIRQNTLAEYLSHQRARKSGVFVRRTDGLKGHLLNFVNRNLRPNRDYAEALHLDPEEARSFFQRRREQRQATEAIFEKHDKIGVNYETLKERETWERICGFLGVPFQPMETVTGKQRRAPLHQMIENYDELKETFSGTEWEPYFSQE